MSRREVSLLSRKNDGLETERLQVRRHLLQQQRLARAAPADDRADVMLRGEPGQQRFPRLPLGKTKGQALGFLRRERVGGVGHGRGRKARLAARAKAGTCEGITATWPPTPAPTKLAPLPAPRPSGILRRMHADELLAKIQDGSIDTVQVAAPDPFGRLVGKRYTGECYARDVANGATHAAITSSRSISRWSRARAITLANWDSGFGDFEMRPDPQACFLLPWEPGAALVLADFHHHDGRPVEEAPRQILRRQLERLGALGLAGEYGERAGVLPFQ